MLKADDTRYPDADLIALTNNGLLYLFTSLKSTLAANYPGNATSPLVLASYSSDYHRGCGLTQGWYPDSSNTAALTKTVFTVRQYSLIRLPNSKDSFQYAIPMKQIFGFMDDYSKVTYGMRDTLQLNGKDDDDALFRTADAGVGKVKLTKLVWSVPFSQMSYAK